MDTFALDTTPDLATTLNQRGTYFVQDVLMSFVIHYGPRDARLVVQDVTHAGKPGKTCPRAYVAFEDDEASGECSVSRLMAFVRANGGDLRRILATITGKPYHFCGGVRQAHPEPGAEFGCSDPKANRVFSPFASFKPLTEKPAKWTIAHVIRALWNGQAAGLRCTGRYTDDYAHDAHVDFGRGPISNARAFAKELIESPSGWWVGDEKDSDRVRVCCHHFNSNEFTLQLQPASGIVPAVAA